jgi:hypothetical protein
MNLHRLDLVPLSLSLFSFVLRTGSISRGVDLARLIAGPAGLRIDMDVPDGREAMLAVVDGRTGRWAPDNRACLPPAPTTPPADLLSRAGAVAPGGLACAPHINNGDHPC